MADELSVQPGVNQTQSNTGAYALTGGIIGGAAGGVGAHYLTKPKYASHEDLIKEIEDSTDFSSKIEEAEGEQKDFLKAAKDVADERANAGKAWDDEFKAFQEAHKDGAPIEDDAYKALVEKQTAAEKALNDKKAQLINDKVTELKNASKTEQVKLEDALNRKVRQLVDDIKYLEKLQAKNASKEQIAKVTARIQKAEAEIDEFASKLAEKLDYGKMKGAARETAVENATEAYKTAFQLRKEQRLRAYDNPLVSEDAKLLNKFTKNREAVKTQEAALEKGLNDLKAVIGGDPKALYEKDPNLLGKKIRMAYTRNSANIEKLANLKTFLDNAVKETSTATPGFLERALQALNYVIDGKPINNVQDLKAYLTENMTPEIKADVDRLLSGEFSEEKLNQIIEKANTKRDALRNATSQVQNAKRQILQLDTEFWGKITRDEEGKIIIVAEGINDEIKARNAYVKNGVLMDSKTHKPIKPANVVPEKPVAVKLPKGVKIPKDATVEFSSKAANLTEDELRQQAESLINASDYETEKLALEEAQKARQTAYDALPKDKTTVTEADFIKEKYPNVKDKAEFVNNKVKEKTDKFAKDFENQFKRKYGFAEHYNWKLAGVIAGGVALGGLIASAFAPKNNG